MVKIFILIAIFVAAFYGSEISTNQNLKLNIEDVAENPTKITSNHLGMILSKANELCDLMKEVDPNMERQFKV